MRLGRSVARFRAALKGGRRWVRNAIYMPCLGAATQNNPVLKAFYQRLIAKGMPVGTLVNDAAFAAQLLNEGFTFVACGTDTSLLARATDMLLTDVKSRLK